MFKNIEMPIFNIKEIIFFKGNEFLFFYLLYIVNIFTEDYHILFFIIYSIIIFSYIFFVHNEINDEEEWPILMLLILPFIMSFNIIRNCLATSIIIFSLNYLKQKKYKKFIITTMCAFLIHYTSAIIFLFYLYYRLISNQLLKRKRLYIILFISSFIISTIILPIISEVFLSTGYSAYVGESFSLLGYIPKLILLLLIYVFYKEIYIELQKKKQLIYLSSFSFLCLTLPIIIFLGGASRIMLFFDYSTILLWSIVLRIIKEKIKYNGKSLKGYIQLVSIIIIIIWITFRIYRIGFLYGIMPYHTDLF